MTSYWFGIAFSLIVFVLIFFNLRAGRMKERYSTWWILIGIAVVMISVFPQILTWISSVFGIVVPLNLGLFAGGVVLLLMTLQYSVDLSRSDDQIRRLAEEIAILSLRVSEMERMNAETGERGAEPNGETHGVD